MLRYCCCLGSDPFTPCVSTHAANTVANIISINIVHLPKKGYYWRQLRLGVATSYGILGAVALFGQSFGISKLAENPVVLLVFAGLFILLGLYMLDVISWQLPHALRVNGTAKLGKFDWVA